MFRLTIDRLENEKRELLNELKNLRKRGGGGGGVGVQDVVSTVHLYINI